MEIEASKFGFSIEVEGVVVKRTPKEAQKAIESERLKTEAEAKLKTEASSRLKRGQNENVSS